MKLDSPSVERNRDAILAVLHEVLPASGTVLEIASGSGQHAIWFAPRVPGLVWQPSDVGDEELASIRDWSAEVPSPNLRAPLRLDVTADDWGVATADAIVCINMVHITPWSTCLALLAGAARVLATAAPLYLYGAYFRRDRATAPSNLEFDRSLRARDARWGVRWLEDVVAAAAAAGLALDLVRDMPNNNYSVVFEPATSAAR